MRVLYVLCVLAVLASPMPGACWGPEAHELIARHAIELLPKEIKPFYLVNSRYVTALVTLPDDWRAAGKNDFDNHHYIDLDLLASPPFDTIPTDRAAAEKKFGKEKLAQAGVLPWAAQERWKKLVKAFKGKDTVGAVVESAVLMHLIGDAHVPFHATKDYDGRTPEQRGIHFRFEENLVSLWLRPESVKPRSPEPVNDVTRSAFKWCIDSYGKIDAILKADNKARESSPGHDYRYFKSLFEDTEAILVDRLSCASEAAAGAIIAAWQSADKPNLPDKPAAMFWGK